MTPSVKAIAVFVGKDTSAATAGSWTPTGAGLGSEILLKADVSVDSEVQLLQVINLATGANVSSNFILGTTTKDAPSMALSTPQILQVSGINYSAATFIATFGILSDER